MRAVLFAIFMLPVMALAADMVNYKDALFTSRLQKRVIKEAVIENEAEIEPAVYEMYLDLPFTLYSEKVMLNGQDITYSYRNRLDLEGQEVLVYLDYKAADEKKVKEDKGIIGTEWAAVKNSPKLAQHYNLTKEKAFATAEINAQTKEQDISLYTGADKADLVPVYPGALGTSITDLEKPKAEAKE